MPQQLQEFARNCQLNSFQKSLLGATLLAFSLGSQIEPASAENSRSVKTDNYQTTCDTQLSNNDSLKSDNPSGKDKLVTQTDVMQGIHGPFRVSRLEVKLDRSQPHGSVSGIVTSSQPSELVGLRLEIERNGVHKAFVTIPVSATVYPGQPIPVYGEFEKDSVRGCEGLSVSVKNIIY